MDLSCFWCSTTQHVSWGEFILKSHRLARSPRFSELDSAVREGEVSNYLGGRKKETKLSTVQCSRGGIFIYRERLFYSGTGLLRRDVSAATRRFPLSSSSLPKLLRYYLTESQAGFFPFENGNDKRRRAQADGRGSVKPAPCVLD